MKKKLMYFAVFFAQMCLVGIAAAQPTHSPGDGDGTPEKDVRDPAPSCFLAQFDRSEVKPGTVNNTWVLIVSGRKPGSGIEISLNPFDHEQKPDYWEIEVVGCRKEIGIPVSVPYTAVFALQEPTMGKKGIKVIGANNKTEKINIQTQ